MNAWLLALEVLPGWEQPNDVSAIHYLLLTLIGPFAVGLVILAIGMAPTWLKRGRQEAIEEGMADPVPGGRRAIDA